MGKASKRHANTIARQIKNNKDTEDFQNMIKAMEDDKNYKLKKNNGYLFDGASLPGKFWKAQFLKPKTETDEN